MLMVGLPRRLLLGVCCAGCGLSSAFIIQPPRSHGLSLKRTMRSTGVLYSTAEAQGSSLGIEVTPELIRKTATLAQLSLSDEEVTRLVPRFQAFLSFVDKMNEVPDAGEVGASGPLPVVTEVLRPDAPVTFPAQEAIFANMRAQEDSCLVVPKVGEEET